MTASLFLLAIEGFSMQKILPSPWAGVAFVFILAIGTHCASAQDVSLKNSVPSITTSGGANAKVVPNIAIISLGVETERPNAADAARDNARAAQAIIGEIKTQGIDARDVATMSVTLSPVYDEESRLKWPPDQEKSARVHRPQWLEYPGQGHFEGRHSGATIDR